MEQFVFKLPVAIHKSQMKRAEWNQKKRGAELSWTEAEHDA